MNSINTDLSAVRSLSFRPGQPIPQKSTVINDSALASPSEQVTLSAPQATESNTSSQTSNGNASFAQDVKPQAARTDVAKSTSAPTILNTIEGDNFSQFGSQVGSLSSGKPRQPIDILAPLDFSDPLGISTSSAQAWNSGNSIGLSWGLPDGIGRHVGESAAQSPSKRAEVVFDQAQRQGCTIEEAATYRVSFSNPDGTAIPDRKSFDQETRAAISEQAKAQGLPVAWEAFDKIDEQLFRNQNNALGQVLFASKSPEEQAQFEDSVSTWRQELRDQQAALKSSEEQK